VRLESVDNAFEQATSAALNMLGIATVHDKVPWFWSDQYELKLVIVGYQTRVVALAIAGFSLVVALAFHNDFADMNQMIHFLKNVATPSP
jgi:hypothetical protein